MATQIINVQEYNRKLKQITVILVYALCVYYLLINGSVIPNWNIDWTYSTLIYLLGVSVFLGIEDKLPNELQKPILHSAIGFISVFLGCTVLFWILRDLGLLFTSITPLAGDLVIPNLVYHGMIVAFSEEIIFRGVIFRVLYQRFNPMIGYLVGSAIFAVFHWSAYGGSIESMLIAFLMGIVLCYCMVRWNIGVAMGLHLAWNAGAIGATLW